MTSTPTHIPSTRRASEVTQLPPQEGAESNPKRNSTVDQVSPPAAPDAPMGVSKSISSDLSCYQFPVDEEEATPLSPLPPMDKAPGSSAMRKTSGVDTVRGRGCVGNGEEGVYKGMGKGVYKGMGKRVYKGIGKGVYKGMGKRVYKGIGKGVYKGMGKRVCIRAWGRGCV